MSESSRLYKQAVRTSVACVCSRDGAHLNDLFAQRLVVRIHFITEAHGRRLLPVNLLGLNVLLGQRDPELLDWSGCNRDQHSFTEVLK